MIHAIAKFGTFYEPPSSFELKEVILQKKNNDRELVDTYKKNRQPNGCSILPVLGVGKK